MCEFCPADGGPCVVCCEFRPRRDPGPSGLIAAAAVVLAVLLAALAAVATL